MTLHPKAREGLYAMQKYLQAIEEKERRRLHKFRMCRTLAREEE